MPELEEEYLGANSSSGSCLAAINLRAVVSYELNTIRGKIPGRDPLTPAAADTLYTSASNSSGFHVNRALGRHLNHRSSNRRLSLLIKQNGISTDKSILVVKVMGTVDKWNAMAAKAQGFYGNPLSGFGP